MKNANENCNVVKEEAGESVSTKLQAVLKRNPDFFFLFTFTIVCQVRNGDDVDPNKDLGPKKIPLLKYTPVTSYDIVPSAYKHIPSDNRQ
jgi:hypothetical protein